jgi:hypothetical protein
LTKGVIPGATKKEYIEIIAISEKLGLEIDQIITPWLLTQDHDIYDQLLGGIRYLDLRTGWDEARAEWRTFHFEFGHPTKLLL